MKAICQKIYIKAFAFFLFTGIMIIGDGMVALIVVLLILITVSVCLVVFVTTYNHFQDFIIRINEAEESIDAVLRKRFDLLNKSIGIIKSNTEEEHVLEMISKLKSKKITNFELDRQLYDAINEFNNYKEKYENLKTCESYLKIEINLFESESEIVALRKYYNDIITDYNKLVKNCPSNFIALLKKYKVKPYFDGNEVGIEHTDFNF